MSAIDDLDDIARLSQADSTAKSTKLRVAGQKRARTVMANGAAMSKFNARRNRFLSEGYRSEPSLPRLKFLEKNDQ